MSEGRDNDLPLKGAVGYKAEGTKAKGPVLRSLRRRRKK